MQSRNATKGADAMNLSAVRQEVEAERLKAKVGTVEIDLNASGHGTVKIDGKPLAGCFAVGIDARVGRPARVTFEMVPAPGTATIDNPYVRHESAQRQCNNSVRRVTRNGVEIPINGSHCYGWTAELGRTARGDEMELKSCQGWFTLNPLENLMRLKIGDGYEIETDNAGTFKARVACANVSTGRCEFRSDGPPLERPLPASVTVRLATPDTLAALKEGNEAFIGRTDAVCECGAAKTGGKHSDWCPRA